MTDYKKLLDQYYDGELTTEQEVELHDWLMSDPANIETFVFEGQLHARLSMRSQAEGFVEEEDPSRWWQRRKLAIAVMFLVMVGAGVSYYLFNSNVAVLSAVSGDVYVKSRGEPVKAWPGKRIYSGNQVQCLRGNSEATIACKDGSCVRLGPRSMLSFSAVHGQYQAYLSSGTLSAVIKKQKAQRPFMISTKSAIATVLGTELSLSAGDDSTSMEVEKGLVRIMRVEDGKKVDVPAGQSIVAAKDADFAAVNWQWSDRFKGGNGSEGTGRGIVSVSLNHSWLEKLKDKIVE